MLKCEGRPLSIQQVLDTLRENVEFVEGEYSEEFEIPLLLKRSQGKRTIIVRGKSTPLPIVGNIIDDRDKLFKITGTSGMSKLYKALTDTPPSMEQAFAWNEFSDYYEKVGFTAWELGALKYYEKDGGRYLTSSVVVACADGVCNASVHRMMILDDRRLVARIVPRHLYYLLRKALERGEELPITILLGAHPLVTLSAATSPALGEFELTIPSRILQEKIAMTRSPLHGNPVPLGTSVIVEAVITSEEAPEGPFVDALCLYDDVRIQPVIKVLGVWKLVGENAYYHAILPGGLEHTIFMGVPREAYVWRTVSRVVPEVKAVRLTHAGGGWLHAIISIKKNHDGDAKNAILAAFAGHTSLKHVVVVDDDIDIDDPQMVEWAIATRFQADRDLIMFCGARGSTLDPSARNGFTCKVGIDATKPLEEAEKFERGRIPGE